MAIEAAGSILGKICFIFNAFLDDTDDDSGISEATLLRVVPSDAHENSFFEKRVICCRQIKEIGQDQLLPALSE